MLYRAVMDTTRNKALEAWMDEHGHSSNSLAEAVNTALEQPHREARQKMGASVRDWKSGRVRWPKAATRRALEEVTGLPAIALGFVPRGRTSSTRAPRSRRTP